ncbi:hypothetical protein [Nonlabens sp. Hel1_33_55]|uniref:hypothetical protein n=1 Tax=Nonlabens sp. Hel1_33_55 TaxID=1336802 RepID=UPI0012FD1E43|nr:hypothetical protein [Nonlabens sp. Hel1_33_55]
MSELLDLSYKDLDYRTVILKTLRVENGNVHKMLEQAHRFGLPSGDPDNAPR